MKIAVKIIGIFAALALLGLVMAYLAGIFEEKIPIDFSKVELVNPASNSKSSTPL